MKSKMINIVHYFRWARYLCFPKNKCAYLFATPTHINYEKGLCY